MTTQRARVDLGVASLSGLVAKLFDATGASDTITYTSDSFTSQTNDVGTYIFTFGEAAVIPAGWHKIKIVNGSGVSQGNGYIYSTGTDNEVFEAVNQPIRPPVVVQGVTLSRSNLDTKPIAFAWPTSGATITGQLSKNQGAYTGITGAITYLRQDGDIYWYSLAYNAADRDTVETNIRYKLTDGTSIRWINLRIDPSLVVNDIADAVLSRDVSNVESTVTEHTLATAILSLLEWSISGGDLVIKRTDGSTVHFTKTLTSATGTGDVITGLN
jgi:hypothetical protein